MNAQQAFRLGLKRFVILLVISAALVALVSEVTFRLQKGKNDRAPQVVQLVIPNGTAKDLGEGKTDVTFPDELVFVVGDTLVVKNEDVAPHKFGPLLIPALSSASLKLDKANRTSYACSFVPSQFMGLDVRPAAGLSARFTAVWLAAPATAGFLFAYSLVLFPIKPRQPAGAAGKI